MKSIFSCKKEAETFGAKAGIVGKIKVEVEAKHGALE
jgi:hypothetical protein